MNYLENSARIYVTELERKFYRVNPGSTLAGFIVSHGENNIIHVIGKAKIDDLRSIVGLNGEEITRIGDHICKEWLVYRPDLFRELRSQLFFEPSLVERLLLLN